MSLVPGWPDMKPESRSESRNKLRPVLKLNVKLNVKPNLMPGLRKAIRLTMLVMLVGSLSVTAVYADSQKKGDKRGKQSNLVEDRSAPRINSRAAASKVKQRFPGSRVLGVSLLDKGGSPMYRVKTLSTNGVVKSVFVDGNSGDVFD